MIDKVFTLSNSFMITTRKSHVLRYVIFEVKMRCLKCMQGKNDFANLSKNLARCKSNFVTQSCQNNYVGRSNWLLQCQNFLQHCSVYST